MKPFFYVYNPAASAPYYKHETMESAVNESRRLAQENRGQRFEVLRCIGFSQVEPHPDCFTPEDLDDELPF